MNLAVDWDRFPREFGGWTLRMILCALPSAILAAFEFHDPFEAAAMTAGVAFYIGGAAWFCSLEAMQATPARARFVRSLKMAAWIKVGCLLVAAVGVGLAWVWEIHEALCLLVGVALDMIAGLTSLWLVGLCAGTSSFDQLHGFGWILAATLLQGAVISAGLALLAAGLCGGSQVWGQRAGQKSFPAGLGI